MIRRASHPLRVRALLAAMAILAPGCGRPTIQDHLATPAERPPQVRAALQRAGEAYQRGNLALTEQFLRQAYAAAQDDPDLALDLGDTLVRMQKMDSARVHYVEFLSRHPSVPSVRLALGLTLMGLGRWQESASQIEHAVAMRPSDPIARFELGIAFVKLGRYAEALPHLKQVAVQSASDPAVFTELGIALMGLNRLDEATQALEHSVAKDPEYVPALFNLGHCYARLGETDKAQEALARFSRASGAKEKYIDQKRLFEAAQGRSDALAREGKDEKALEALLAYADALKDFAPFQQELGVAYLRLGRREEAIRAFERAVSRQPSLTESHAQLAVLYQQAGQPEKAMKERQSAARTVSYNSGVTENW
jgi:tetratricopeptide (TPR) repeat protein